MASLFRPMQVGLFALSSSDDDFHERLPDESFVRMSYFGKVGDAPMPEAGADEKNGEVDAAKSDAAQRDVERRTPAKLGSC